jgi:hypothetical protein
MFKSNGGVAGLIRREIGSETNTRFLRSLPAFRLDRDLPVRFQELLGRLDEATGEGSETKRSR